MTAVGDARKRRTEAHQIHPDPAVRDLVAREVAAAVRAVEAERDVYRARADILRAKLSGTVALRGGKPGDYWAEWHRDHCAAAEAAANAEKREADLRAAVAELLADLKRGNGYGGSACGVCSGHSPSWDGHSRNCREALPTRLRALLQPEPEPKP